MTALSHDASAGDDIAPAPTSASRMLSVALLPGTLFLVAFVWRAGANPYGGRRFTLFDDAMISMTYARTLVDTGEWVWFADAERVQGITNPLWSLYMALLHLVGLEGSDAALAVALTGAGAVVAAAVLTFMVVRTSLGTEPGATVAAAVAAGAVPFLYPFTFWSLRGMEVGVLAVLLLVMVGATPLPGHSRSGAGLALAAAVLGVLTRVDFAVFVVALASVSFVWPLDPAARSDRGQRRAAGALAATGLLTVGLVLLFQRAYWHDWLPNTYWLKVEGSPMSARLTRGMVSLGKSVPVLLIVGIAMTVTHRLGSPDARRRSLQLASVVAAGAAYGVWVGGDAWESYLYTSRYLSVVLPAALAVVLIGATTLIRSGEVPRWVMRAVLLVPFAALGAGLVSNPYRFHVRFAVGMVGVAMLAVAGLAMVWRGRGAPAARYFPRAVGIAAVVVALSGAYPSLLWLESGGLHVTADQLKTEEGVALADATEPEATIAVSWAGALAYYADRPMIDLLGKSDRVIARLEPRGAFNPGHNKLDYDHSVGELRPDVVFRQAPTDTALGGRLEAWGYERLCLRLGDGQLVAAYFLTESRRVRREELSVCPTGG